MKNKYSALFVAVVLCFTFLFGTVATAFDADSIPPEIIEGALEGVLGEDPSDVGAEIMGGIYEGAGFLQTIYDVLENIKIFLSNIVNYLFDLLNINDSSTSIFG